MRELRRRKVRFPLIVSDNIKIRRLEELKQHPDIRAILSSYEEGKLITWLRDRYEDEVADNIEALDKNSCDFGSDLLACLGIQANVQIEELSAVALSNEKKNSVKRITADPELIKEFDHFAFNNEQLEWLLKSNAQTIYLPEGTFELNVSLRPVTIIGIKNPTIDICSYSFNDLRRAGVKCSDITLTSGKMRRVESITEDEYIRSNFECVAFDNYSFHDLLKKKFVKKIWLYGGGIFALLKPERSVEIIGINHVTIDLVESSFNELKEKNVTLSNVNCTSVSLEKVRDITSDEHIINNFEKVAFTDDELKKLMQNSKYSSIYLYGDCFRIPYINRHINIKGINSPHVEFENGNTFDDYYKNGIKLTDVIPTTGAVNTDMLSVGKEFYFGTYDNEQIKWIVISQTKEKITALAVNLKLSFALESNYQWKNSSLREWLNREFYNSAFNVFEQFQMIEAKITCQEQNTRYEVQDKVYILSKDEIDLINDKYIRHVLEGSWLRKAEHTWGYADIFDSYGSFRFQRASKQYGVIPVITLKNLNK